MRGIFTEADRLFLKVRNQFEMLASTPLNIGVEVPMGKEN